MKAKLPDLEIDLGPPYYINPVKSKDGTIIIEGTENPPKGIINGRYVVVHSLLNSPTQCSFVFVCIDQQDGIKKVIKFVKVYENKTPRIQNEILTMRAVRHPNVIPLLDFFRYRQYMCLILPYTEHMSLMAYLSMFEGGMPEELAAQIMRQMLIAVGHLHGVGIWHRDIKPDNFLVFDAPPIATDQPADDAQSAKSTNKAKSTRSTMSASDTRSDNESKSANDSDTASDPKNDNELKSANDANTASDPKSANNSNTPSDLRSDNESKSANDSDTASDLKNDNELKSSNDANTASDPKSANNSNTPSDLRSDNELKSANDSSNVRDSKSSNDSKNDDDLKKSPKTPAQNSANPNSTGDSKSSDNSNNSDDSDDSNISDDSSDSDACCGPVIVLSDFGFANAFGPDEKVNQILGTPLYMAPEILDLVGYNQSVDIYALGVSLAELLLGIDKFDLFKTKRKIRNMRKIIPVSGIKESTLRQAGISEEAIDLIMKLCNNNPELRITPEIALKHQWFLSVSGKSQTERDYLDDIGPVNEYVFNIGS